MKYRKQSTVLTALLLVTMLVFTANSCSDGQAGQVDELKSEIERLEDLYKPGLHSLMNETMHRHSSLWFAGVADNWELAYYQHHELEEVFEKIEELYPEYDGEPIATLIGNMTSPAMEEVEEAIEAQNPVRFREAFTNLTASCNSCHESTNRQMIHIIEPDQNTVRNLRF
ncbi:MAG: cytochrome c [Rhodothermaceae bacterium]|nr:cytochrome c [Rhodothermaceae bacterium]